MNRAPAGSRWLAGVLLLTCLLGGRSPRVFGQAALSGSPDLSTEQRARLLETAQDTRLEPWQRDFIHNLAAPVAQPSPGREASDSPCPAGPRLGSTNNPDGVWKIAVPPPFLGGHTAIYDPLRERMVVFGGTDGADRNDVWVLSLAPTPAWTELTTEGTPPPERHDHTAVYDPSRDRMVIFGGDDGSGNYRNDTWVLSFGGAIAVTPTWSQLDPLGTPPSRRKAHVAIYDPAGDRMVIFGGDDGSGSYRNDTWELSFGGAIAATPTWSQLDPAGTLPPARSSHTAIYDPVRDRMVICGGRASTYLPLNDTWALSLGEARWTNLDPSGPLPPVGGGHTAIHDPAGDRMVVYGGFGGSFAPWALSLAGTPAWSMLSPSGPMPDVHDGHTAIHDPVRGEMVVFAGFGLLERTDCNDIWRLSLGTNPAWSHLAPTGTAPPKRNFHTAIWDAARSEMVIFGGCSVDSTRTDTWALSFTGMPPWRQIATYGSLWEVGLPVSIYDPVRDRMLLYTYENEYCTLWQLPLANPGMWQPMPGLIPPPARAYETAIYDPVRDRMVIFGGESPTVQDLFFNDTWALSLAGIPAWTQLTPSGTPPPARGSHTAVYDPGGDRMVIFGGGDSSGTFNDTWALSLAGAPVWNRLTPSGTPPSARWGHTAIWHPLLGMVIFGGNDGAPCRDLWTLSPGPSPGWRQLAPSGAGPSPRFTHTAIYDATGDRMVIFGGFDQFPCRDTWELDWPGLGATAVTGPGAPAPCRLALEPARPNPASGPTLLRFDLPAAGVAQLTIYDASGRLVRRLVDGPLAAGAQRARWDGRDSAGRGVAPGVYYARLEANEESLTRKLVILR